MIPACNKKRCAAVPFETGIHFRRKTDFLPEEDTTMSYSGFEPEPTRLQAEGHSHHTGWATIIFCHVSKNDAMDENEEKSVLAGDQKPKLLFKNPKERGFRNGVRDAENTCIHTKA
ncbi:hypothetical protein TNCV_3919381 [Trichonephila clavipes]|nr:hypothetical protein TNCV_3919381 [Trichonephila clavipes]